MRNTVFAAGLMTLFLVVASITIADQPQTLITYQGQLADAGGDPISDTTLTITFTIYPDSVIGSPLWTETQSVDIVGGLFNVELGSVDSLTADVLTAYANLADFGIYLEVQILGDTPMSPRSRLTAVPYSTAAQRVSGDIETEPGSIIITAVPIEGKTYDWAAALLFEDTASETLAVYSPKGVLLIDPDSCDEDGKVGGVNSCVALTYEDTSSETLAVYASGGLALMRDQRTDVELSSNELGGYLRLLARTSAKDDDSESRIADWSGIVYEDTASETLAVYSPRGMAVANDGQEMVEISSDDDGGTVTVIDVNPTAKMPADGRAFDHLTGLILKDTSGETLAVYCSKGIIFPDGTEQTTAASGGSCNWSVASSILSTNSNWGIARGGANNHSYGSGSYTMVNLGVACTTGIDFTTNYYQTISGGQGNVAGTSYSAVGGGLNNGAYGGYGAISGGWENYVGGYVSFVGGGYQDSVHGRFCGIASGHSNLVGDQPDDSASFIGGGRGNHITESYSVIAGGYENTVDGRYGTIGGGYRDTVGADYAVVGGGYGNNASGEFSTVCGGGVNEISGDYGAIGGGSSNSISGHQGAIGGGVSHDISGDYSALGGGHSNQIESNFSAIPGGESNHIYSSAHYSLAFGYSVGVQNSFRVVFFDGSASGRLGINRDGSDGGLSYPIHVGTNTGNGNGAYLTSGGTWTNGSSREFKENFRQLDGQDVLGRLDELPMQSWEYKGTGETHIWPCAEDFHEAFDVGVLSDDGTRDVKFLAAGDVAGVALIGVQELNRMVRQLQQTTDELHSKTEEIESLRADIAQLQSLVEAMLMSQRGQPAIPADLAKFSVPTNEAGR